MPREVNSRPALAFDFDGVICDSTEECIVTAWNAWGDSLVRTADEVPEPYGSALRRERNYVRTAGEYLIVLEAADKECRIRSQADYESMYRDCESSLGDFATRFFNARDWLRNASEQEWLNLHTIYPGIPEGLRELADDYAMYVVTGKDRDSVKLFFDRMKLPLPDEQIYDKDAARDKLQAIRKINPECFIDDNIIHLRPIHEAGFRALMADWGYHTAEHMKLAKALGVPVVGLSNWVDALRQSFATQDHSR